MPVPSPIAGWCAVQDFNGEKDVLGIRLNWEKRYITLAPVATLLGLAFQLYDPDHLLGDKETIGITVALIPTNHQGVEIGTRHFALDIPFQNGPTYGRDVFIPMDWLIGGQAQAGKGWRMLVECLGRRARYFPACVVHRGGESGGTLYRRVCTGPPAIRDADWLF